MKAITSSLQMYLVQKLKISNQEACRFIGAGRVMVNGLPGHRKQQLLPEDVVELDAQIIKTAQTYLYIVYYKPRGVESTLNPAIPANLKLAFSLPAKVFPVGRLDKDSEGLLLLTNNGQLYDKIIHPDHHQEKEYRVTVNQPLTPAAITQLSTGLTILGRQTRPAQVQVIDTFTFQIILTQGLNRQIRRMCYKLGYQVLQLVRVRIINIELGNLIPGQWRYLAPAELQKLQEAINYPKK